MTPNIEAISTIELMKVLDLVKGVKSEYIYIPRIVVHNTPIVQIAGISDNALCHIADLEGAFNDNNLLNKPFWTNQNLTGIVMMTKDINPYLKTITDYASQKAIRDNNLNPKKKIDSVLLEQAIPMLSFMQLDEVVINDRTEAVGRLIYTLNEDNNIIEYSSGLTTTRSSIELYPMHIVIDPIQRYVTKWIRGHSVCECIDITSDSAFQEILSLKASEGARIWCPDVLKYGNELKSYIFYINKTILNNTKSDKVFLSIRDQLPDMDSRYFMVRLDVEKIKKGTCSNYSVYLLCIKIA